MTLRSFRRYLDCEKGGATIEFIVVFPVVVLLLFEIVEVGWIGARYMMLERGLDIAVRDVRLGVDPDETHDSLKRKVCDHAFVLKNCERDLVLELVEMDLDSAYPQNQANCYDRSEEIEPVIDFRPGARNSIMFVRACMIVDLLLPGAGIGLRLPKDSTGGYQLISYAAFMNEPA